MSIAYKEETLVTFEKFKNRKRDKFKKKKFKNKKDYVEDQKQKKWN
jgi:hypothetical protein